MVKSGQKNGSNRSNDGNVNSVEGFTNKENVLHLGRNVVNARKKIIGQTRDFSKHFAKPLFLCSNLSL